MQSCLLASPNHGMVYVSGSQPVARGPKVARQASKSGPRPPKEFLKNVQQQQNSHFDRVGQWGMSRYARYGENN